MRGFRSRASVTSAITLIDDHVEALGSQGVDLWQAADRVLASEVVAVSSVPAFDRAAMDGYALKGEETFGADAYAPAHFRVTGRSRPGVPFSGRVGEGEAVEIATGAPMPDGADAVARVEAAYRDGSSVRIAEPTPPRRHVGFAGEDVAIGTRLFAPGRVLRPQDLGVLSALGMGQISCIARPRVAILITGDEILPAGSRAEGCRFADMNGPMLSALVARDGGLPAITGPLPDDRLGIRDAIASAARSSDVVFLSGGSSTGPEDHAPGLIDELGELAIHGVALRPASPTGIGFVEGRLVLLMPGNPVSCLCAYDLFGGRIVRRLGGRPAEWPGRARDLPLGEKLVSSLGRVDYVRVRIVEERVIPLATSGASILSGASRADGFVLVPASREGYHEGAVVTVHRYEG